MKNSTVMRPKAFGALVATIILGLIAHAGQYIADAVNVTTLESGVKLYNYDNPNMDYFEYYQPPQFVCDNAGVPCNLAFIRPRVVDINAETLKDGYYKFDPNSVYTDDELRDFTSRGGDGYVTGVYDGNHGVGLIPNTNPDGYFNSVEYGNGGYSAASTYQVVGTDADGRTRTQITVNAHIGTICSNCTTYPKDLGWIMRNVDGMETPTHGLDLEFYLTVGTGINDSQFSALSNSLNDLIPEAETKYEQNVQLEADITTKNEELRAASEQVVSAANDEIQSEKDLDKKREDLALEEDSSNSNETEERHDAMVTIVSDMGLGNMSVEEAAALLASKQSSQASNIENQFSQILNSINSLNGVASGLSAYGENIMAQYTGNNYGNISDYEPVNDQIKPGDYIADPEFPEFPPIDPMPEEPPKNPFDDSDLRTQPDSPAYSKLIEAVSYYQAAEEAIDPNSEGAKQTLEMAAVGIDMADAAYSEDDSETGDSFLSTSLSLIDAAIDFVPGASLAKDAVTIWTGVNPITGENVSDSDRAIMLGSLFAPSIISGSFKVLQRGYKAMDKVVKGGGELAPNAGAIKNGIEESDAALEKYALDGSKAVKGEISDDVLRRFTSARKEVDSEKPLMGKKVNALKNTKPGEYYEGVEKVWGKTVFRNNMKKLNDPDMADDLDAHHMFPQDLRREFKDAGIHIDDPRVMVPFPNGRHQQMHGAGYNQAWDEFLTNASGGRTRTYDEVISFAHQLARDPRFDFEDLLPGHF